VTDQTTTPEPRQIFIPEEAIEAGVNATDGTVGQQAVTAILKAADKHLGFQAAGRSLVWAADRVVDAKSVFEFAEAVRALNEARSDLASWLDGYDERTGELHDPNGGDEL